VATSFVEFRGRGFWSWDGYLEHVLALVAAGLSEQPVSDWKAELRDDWKVKSSGIFLGFVDARLDDFLTNDERCNELIRVLDDIASQPNLRREARETIGLFKRLLRGEITTDASSPLDYMVTGEFPYDWTMQ
jgi:hypothetical protein